MNKREAKDIAKVLIAKVAKTIDIFAFEDCNGFITDSDTDKIMHEIKQYCEDVIIKMEDKHKVKFGNSTKEVIQNILFK